MSPGDTVWTRSGNKFILTQRDVRDPSMWWFTDPDTGREFRMAETELLRMPPKKPETPAPPPLGGLFE